MKLLCVGDIHLGRQPARLPAGLLDEIKASELGPAAAWRLAVDFALADEVDAVLLAGDVVEQEDDFYEAYGDLRRGVDRLTAAGIQVLAVSGNHDVQVLPRLADAVPGFRLLGRGGAWEVRDVAGRDGRRVQVLGWSFPEPRVSTSPLVAHELPALDSRSAPVVGLLHCDRDAAGSPYAPVRSAELAHAPVDAWLLGHIHKPDRLAPPRPIGYLGSLTGLDPGEPGPRGPWRLECAGPELALEHLPLAPLRWEEVEVALDGLESAEDVHTFAVSALDALHERLAAERFRPRAVGCRLRFTGRTAHRREAARSLAASDPLRVLQARDDVRYFVHDWRFEASPAWTSTSSPGAPIRRPSSRARSSCCAGPPRTPIVRRSSPAPVGASSRWVAGAPSPRTVSPRRPRRKRLSFWSGPRSGRSPSFWTSARARHEAAPDRDPPPARDPPSGFELDGFADGINVVVGPNASGKTSIPRAVRAALYGEELARESVDVEAVFALGDEGDEDERDRGGMGTGRGRASSRPPGPAVPSPGPGTGSGSRRRRSRSTASYHATPSTSRTCWRAMPTPTPISPGAWCGRWPVGTTSMPPAVNAVSPSRPGQGRRKRTRSRRPSRISGAGRPGTRTCNATRNGSVPWRGSSTRRGRRSARRPSSSRRSGFSKSDERGPGSSGVWRRFPSGLERLSGDEAETLERLDGERRRAERDLARAEADRRAAERTLAATGLAGSPLDEGRAADLRPRIARLELLEGELARVRDRAEEEAAARDRAARELGGEPGEGVRLGPEAVHAADQALDAIRQIASELRELDAELNRLPGVPETEPDPERVDEARRELLHWLSAPDVSGTPAARAGALLVLAATGIAGAVAAGHFFHPAAYALLAPTAIALVYVFLLLRRAGVGARQRLEAEQRYRRSGFKRPETWERERVDERLFELDRELVAARQREEDLRRRRRRNASARPFMPRWNAIADDSRRSRAG